MRTQLSATIPVALLLAACSAENGPSGPGDAMETRSETQAAAADQARSAKGESVKISVPKLSYSYVLGYRLPSDDLLRVQQMHVDMCQQLGADRCQMVAMEGTSENDTTPAASLKLRVATAIAQDFARNLNRTVTNAGGRTLDTNVAAEDVSRSIVDTEARIRQREILVARLTDVLRQRKGSVEELVNAERSVTQAQEELDQSRGWLAELQGRVAMSNFEIRYTGIAPASQGSFAGQLGEAGSGSLSSFAVTMRILLTMAIYLAPWALLIGGPLAALALLRRRRERRAAAIAASA